MYLQSLGLIPMRRLMLISDCSNFTCMVIGLTER